MRTFCLIFLLVGLARIAGATPDESEQVSRYERAALNRESAAESYRMEAEKLAKDSDFLANSMAPSATNFKQRAYYVDSAGVQYEKAGDLMLMARKQYQLALTNWSNAEREYRFWEDAEPKVNRALAKVEENRLEAYHCAGLAADYLETGADHYADVEKFEKQAICLGKAAQILEEVARERARRIRKKTTEESPPSSTGGAP